MSATTLNPRNPVFSLLPDLNLANLFTGSVVSDWVISEPPHAWLFAELPRWAETSETLPGLTPDEILTHILDLINQMTWQIERNARVITKESVASLVAQEYTPQTIVGHHVTTILECALEIRKAIEELPAYLDGTRTTKI